MTLTTRKRTGLLVRWIPACLLLALCCVAAVFTTLPASAQSTDDETRTRQATADRLARSAILTLRNTDPPMPIDYQVCAEQLGVALLLRPNDPHILRAMREALYRAGDIDGFNEATRQLALLEPNDTVLQLAVISARITSIQNADDRLAAYERLLSAGSSSLDAAVQSRLAFDGAMLAEEQGDSDRFVRLLTQAVQLDSTNKEAAARAADYFLATETDPRGRIEILANVILADPLDPAAHLNIAREFLRYGATHAGERFLNNAVRLWRLAGEGQDEGTLLQRYALQWLHEGGDRVLEDLAEMEAIQRYSIEQQRKMLEEEGEDPEQVPPFRPEPVMERVRLSIASAAGDFEVANKAMMNIEKGIREVIMNAQEALESDNPPEIDDVEQRIGDLLVESLYLRLWSGLQLEKAEATIDQLAKDTGNRRLKPEALDRYRGWIAAHAGEYEKAVELLEPTSEEEPFAMLGLGIAGERAGNRRAAMRAYAHVALDEPGSMMSVWAQRRLEFLLGSEVTPTPQAKEMEALARSLPTSIDEMVAGPAAFLNFETRLVSDRLDLLGRVLVRHSVRNVGKIPVAVGERSPLRTSAMMIPRVTLSGLRAVDSVDPEVISFNRRLRLKPRETMTFEVWADMGPAGALLDVESPLQATMRWRTIIGFQIDQYGQYAPSGTSLDSESNMASRPRLAELGSSAEDVGLAVELAEPGEPLLITLLQARSLLLMTLNSNASDAEEVQQSISQAIAVRYETMTDAERAFTMTMLPPAQSIPSVLAIDDLARDSADPIVTVAMLRRLTDADDEEFNEAMASDDPVVRRLGTILHHRLDRARRIRSRNAEADAGAETDR